MGMLLQGAAALFFCAAVCLLIYAVKGWLMAPLCSGKEIALKITVTAQGDAPTLQQTIRSLFWLCGNVNKTVCLQDAGLTPEARKAAEILEKKYGLTLVDAHTQAGDAEWKRAENIQK